MNKKKDINYSPVVVAGVFALIGLAYLAGSFAAKPDKNSDGLGNGAPNGRHYNLNIIGVSKDKTADITSGNRLFVPLEGNCRVNLEAGDFAVRDGNCTDGKSEFSLPNPDSDGDGVTEYTVWARPLGKPGGKSKLTTCGVDPLTGEDICSIKAAAYVRDKGKNSFSNSTKEFLTVLADIDGDETTPPQTVSVFDPELEGYLWDYDNQGLRLLQVRFYEQAK